MASVGRVSMERVSGRAAALIEKPQAAPIFSLTHWTLACDPGHRRKVCVGMYVVPPGLPHLFDTHPRAEAPGKPTPRLRRAYVPDWRHVSRVHVGAVNGEQSSVFRIT